jgi:fido (protein-threonine AMPylation protein)
MHPADCPNWEYDHLPDRAQLRTRSANLLGRLRGGGLDAAGVAADSRPVHGHLFNGLTPPGHDYFAGHYRGEVYRCLQYLNVQVGAHRGALPDAVGPFMEQLAREIAAGLAGLDRANDLPHTQLPSENKLLYAVMFACRVFEMVLRIHPYANGNGHAARFVLISILGRYGYWLNAWQIDPHPPDPPYTQLITDYRQGKCEPLERFVLRAIASN